MEKIMNNILETKWFDKNKKLLFGLSKSSIAGEKNNENNYSVKSFMGTINTIISNYGLKMISKKKTIGNKENKIGLFYYYLAINSDYEQFI